MPAFVHLDNYEARRKFAEYKRCARVARAVADSNSTCSFLSALQTSQVLHISINAQLTQEPIIVFADVISVHSGNKHARTIEFDYTNLLATL